MKTIKILTALIFVFLMTFGVIAIEQPIIDLEPTTATVGDEITVVSKNLTPTTEYQLIWHTFDGNWKLGYDEDGNFDGQFLGPEFEPTSRVLTTVKTDADGKLNTTFVVPEDFGGAHDVTLVKDGNNVTKGGLRIIPSVEYSPKEGPVGTPITVTVKGFNHPHWVEGWYQLFYDNAVTGYLTGMKTRGTATATIPATGHVGEHFIEIQNAPFGHAYRALETSPYDYLPTFKLPFTVTEGDPVLPGSGRDQIKPAKVGKEPVGDGPAIWFDPAGDAIGAPTTVYGKGFPAGKSVDIYKYGRVGSRVTVSGWDLVKEPLTEVTVNDDGSFQKEVAVPATHGGTHTMGASVDGEELAHTTLQVYRTPVQFKPVDQDITGPYFEVTAGTKLELDMQGIGWSEIENIYAITYDNRYIGYSCGFSTGGDVKTYLTATGEPGWHFISIYPTFYRNDKYAEGGRPESPFLYRAALLSHNDHPNPFVFHFAFKIVEEK